MPRDPTTADGTRVPRTTATSASTPKSEDTRRVGGVENASVVRDKLLAASDAVFKKNNKQATKDLSGALSKGQISGTGGTTTVTNINCKDYDSNASYSVRDSVDKLDKELEQFTNQRILGYGLE